MADFTDRHAKRFPRMWWKLGLLLEARAYELAQSGMGPQRAIGFAQAAEACFWQATGEGDYSPLSEIARGGSDA